MTAPLYEIPVHRIDGAETSLGEHEGSVLLIVNVASKCGLTPQYAGLQQLHETYSNRGLNVLGFPANDFGAQEPGTNDEIMEFCQTTYDVTFPMYAKVAVKGEAQHPLYRYLVDSKPAAEGDKNSQLRQTLAQYGLGPTNDTDVLWNFEKFLISRDGEVVARFSPDMTPDDPRIIAAVEGELARG